MHVLALTLLAAGAAVVLLSALAIVLLRGPYARLHALAPASTLGAPLVAVAAAVDTGPGRAALKLVVIGLLLALGGSVSATAAGRAQAVRDSRTDDSGTGTGRTDGGRSDEGRRGAYPWRYGPPEKDTRS